MDSYCVRVIPQGRWGSLPQSDTLFGQLCWTLRLLAGEQQLEEFLAAYADPEPPLVLSDGLPEGFLPRPLLPRITPSGLRAGQGVMDLKAREKEKESKNVAFVRADWFLKAREDLTAQGLTDALVESPTLGIPNPWLEMLSSHNTVDRNRGTVRDEGGFFQQVDYEMPRILLGESATFAFVVYVKSGFFSHGQLSDLFAEMQKDGFGRDSSVGLGRFSFAIEPHSFPALPSPNGFVALSNFVPAEHDPTEGFWEVATKYGKVGGNSAFGSIAGRPVSNPFKKPLVMLRRGSVFHDEPVRSHYGQLMQGIHDDPSIRHYGICYPLEVRL